MKRYLWIGVSLLLVAAMFGYQQLSPGVQKKSETQGGRSGAVPVTVANVVQKSMPVQLEAVGSVDPYSTVSVRAQIGGTITRVHFAEGQDVKQGDLLFTIDPRPYEAALKQAEANLAKDMAMLANAREQVRRYSELVGKQLISQEQFDQIRTNSNALEATAEADKAAVENAKVQLSYCRIYSPVTGRTGSLLVNEGNLVRTNDATAMVTINQINPIYATFSVPEQNLDDIRQRMNAGKLRVEAFLPQNENRPEEGTLSFIDNAVDRTTGTIKLKATFANTDRRLWPGQFVKVVLKLAEQPDMVVIPSQAIQTGQEGDHVFVIQPNSTVEVRSVVVSRTLGGEAVIGKGLKPGERVVIDGQFLLAPGTKVQLRDEKQDGQKKREKKDGQEAGKQEKEVES